MIRDLRTGGYMKKRRHCTEDIVFILEDYVGKLTIKDTRTTPIDIIFILFFIFIFF